jgi:hypothetical protein
MGLPDSTWVPGLPFALLGLFFLQKAIRPGARQSWSWGRGGGPVPVSRLGYACWAATFFAIGVIVAHAPKPPLAAVVAFTIFCLATLGVGFVDTYRYKRSQPVEEPPRDPRV